MKGLSEHMLSVVVILFVIGGGWALITFKARRCNIGMKESIATNALVHTAYATHSKGYSIKFDVARTDAFEVLRSGLDRTGSSRTQYFVNIGTHRKIDYEDDNKLTFQIEASSWDGAKAVLSCSAIVSDVNDEKPIFTNQTYYTRIQENTPNGTVVFANIEVTDKDFVNSLVSVTCEKTPLSIRQLKPGHQHPCDMFSIVTKSQSNRNWVGNVVVKDSTSLDYEKFVSKTQTAGSALSNIYSIPAMAFDGVNKNTEALIVEVTDQQDKPPIITQGDTISVKDQLPPGSHIVDIVARDGDFGVPRKLCYFILPDPGKPTYLAIRDPRKPIVTSSQVLDREKIPGATITARFRVSEVLPNNTCSLNPLEQAEAFIRVKIVDINDNAPYFVPDRKQIALSERTNVNVPIPNSTLSTFDKDVGDNARYHVQILGPENALFSITQPFPYQSGNHYISLKKKLDYDDPNTKKQYVLSLLAKETKTPRQLTGTATLTLRLTDINDNTPQFDSKRYRTEIYEDLSIHASVITITANDKDSGDYGKSGIVYELIGTGTDKFNIGRKTGAVTVADCSPSKPGEGRCIDYEATKSYSLSVVATDDNGKGNQNHTELVIIILDVNDNAPYCLHANYESSMPETSFRPDPPLEVKANDKDSSTSGNNAIQYSIISGNSLKYFIISSNGSITARNLIDYETLTNNGVFRMIVEVRDAKFKGTCQAVVRVLDVNDNTPIFGNRNYETSIPETTPPGTILLTVAATDNDDKKTPNGQIRYRIELGGAGKFTVDAMLGNITVASNAKFDYDLTKRYVITVLATDRGFPQKTGTASVTVNILDRNTKSPVLIPSTIRVAVMENATVGTCLTTIKAIDPDSNASLVYDIMKPQIKAYLSGRVAVDKTKYDVTNLIKIDRKTGLVCTNRTLDYEKAAEIELPIMVTDVNALTLQTGTGTLYVRILDINEHDPVFIDTENMTFPHYNITMREELPLDTFVVTMVATDVDSSEISAYNMIDSGNGFVASQKKTGVITLKKRVDYEKMQKFSFVVEAKDVGVPIRSATATVFVTVINMNDNIPQFNQSEYNSTILEHSPENTYVTTVGASDLDAGDYGVVRFKMTDRRFKVDNITGVIRVAKGAVLDREKTPVINVKMEAFDSPKQMNVSNNNYVSVVITLLDINDHPPKFDEQNYYAQITENTPVTTSILQLRATDGDHSCKCINAQIRYTKIPGSGDVKGYFLVNQTTGLITVKTSLIGESYSHKFEVLARDGFGSGKFSVSASVTISVIDANNKPPQFIRPPSRNSTISVLENQYRGLLVYRVRAIDPDGDLNSPITYGFRVNNKMVDRTNEFRINNITGQIRAERVFDREEIDKYLLHVSAADHGVPSFVTTIDLVVLILDVDDNLPEFPKFRNGSVLPYSFSVAEDAKANFFVGVIEAIDKDTKASTSIKYSIVNGNVDNSFRIESRDNRGYIYTDKILDREKTSNYELLCRASNRATSYNLNLKRRKRAVEDASATVVRLFVTDVNDNVPQFVLPTYRACVPTNAPFGKSILDVKAKDKDTGEAGKVFYALRNIKTINKDGQSRDRADNTFTISKLNGTMYTNALLNQDGKTYFDMQVVGYNNDSKKTEGTSSARVFVTESATRVKVSIKRSPDEVNRYIKDYTRVIAESLGSKVVCVEATRYHINADNIIEVDKADLIVHVVNMEQNSIYPASEVVRKMKTASDGNLLSDYKVLFIFDINPVEVEETEVTLHPLFIIMCIIVVITLVALVLLALICIFLNRQYKREMRKAKYAQEGPVEHNTPGGTVNPLWKERMDTKGYEDSGEFVNKAYEPDLPAM